MRLPDESYNTPKALRGTTILVAIVCSLATIASAATINNGTFETGLTGWTRADQAGSEGTFQVQMGTVSPMNGFAVPAPPEGSRAAMTDAQGPGAHILYQDFVVPVGLLNPTLTFMLYINNRADAFSTPNSLDFSTPTLNQQARVDILTTSADPFSVAGADILQNVFQTQVGDPLVSGYRSYSANLTSLFQSRAGQTLRLRFAETDNVLNFNLGVDNVNIETAVPEPGYLLPIGGLLLAVAGRRFRRS